MAFSLSRVCASPLIAMVAVLLLFAASPAAAQSTDVRFPTGVNGGEIYGAIAARDMGDSRLTDHFYTFNGLPGDLLITVQSRNLNGDFDVFTAAELRPVMKITVYAGISTAITKDIYLRKSESLILRVEARSPNDDKGSYSIHFSGSFDPISNAPLAESVKPSDESNSQAGKNGDRKTTRVSSVGARIEEPAVEVAVKPTPEPTPVAPTEESPSSPTKKTVAVVRAPRRSRARANPTKAPAKPVVSDANKSDTAANKEEVAATPVTTEPAKPETESKAEPTPKAGTTNNPVAEESKDKPEPTATGNNPPAPKKSTSRSSRRPPRSTNAEPPPEDTQRLLIEVKDGSRIEYVMSNVRRITVENGVVVIISKAGNMQRVPMSSIVRMSIGP